MPDYEAFPPLAASRRHAAAVWTMFEDVAEARHNSPDPWERANLLGRLALEYVFEISDNPVDALVTLEHFRDEWRKRPRPERTPVPLAVPVTTPVSRETESAPDAPSWHDFVGGGDDDPGCVATSSNGGRCGRPYRHVAHQCLASTPYGERCKRSTEQHDWHAARSSEPTGDWVEWRAM